MTRKTKSDGCNNIKLRPARIQRFTDVLRGINRDQDPTLAWNSSCEHAQCGSCSVVINDMPLLACELLVENAVRFFGTTEFTIGPINVAPVVRDLVVDFEVAYDRVHQIKPYIIQAAENPEKRGQYRIAPTELGKIRRGHALYQLLLLCCRLYQHPQRVPGTQRGTGERRATDGSPRSGQR